MDKFKLSNLLKSSVACLLVLIISLGFFPTSVLAAISNGDGTQDNPYVIKSAAGSVNGEALYADLTGAGWSTDKHFYADPVNGGSRITFTSATGTDLTGYYTTGKADVTVSAGVYKIVSETRKKVSTFKYQITESTAGYISIEKIDMLPFTVSTENAIIEWSFFYKANGTNGDGKTISDVAFNTLCTTTEAFDSNKEVKLQVYYGGLAGYGAEWRDYTSDTMGDLGDGDTATVRFLYDNIAYPSNDGFTVTLKDTRIAPDFNIPALEGVYNYVDKPSEGDIEADVKAALVAKGMSNTIDVDISNITYGTVLFGAFGVNEGETKSLDFTVTLPGTATHSSASGTVTYTIRNITDANSNGIHDDDNDEIKHTITWKNGDTVLESDVVLDSNNGAYLQSLSYDGETPIQTANAQYTYSFVGWADESGVKVENFTNLNVDKDMTFTALFDKAVNKYTVTWVDYDGTELSSEVLDYGTSPEYKGETPTRENGVVDGGKFTYSFSGWTPEVDTVTGDITYTATYEATEYFSVVWQNEDGSEIYRDEVVAIGTVPMFVGAALPSKDATAQYTYTFAGWDADNDNKADEIVKLEADTVYKAVFTAEVNRYTVVWQNEDGTVLEKDENVAYGEIPTCDIAEESITKPNPESGKVYTFAGWTPEVKAVEGNATYTAKFSSVALYTITKDWNDGTEADTSTKVEQGDIYNAPEGKSRDNYRFDGWDVVSPEGWSFGDEVTSNIVIKAKWVATVTVSFVVDGVVKHTEVVDADTSAGALEMLYTAEDTDSDNRVFSAWKYSTSIDGNTVTMTALWSDDLDNDGIADGTENDPYWTIVYIVDGVRNVVDDKFLNYDSEAVIPTVNDPAKTDWLFNGWFKMVDTDTHTVSLTAVWLKDINNNAVNDDVETVTVIASGAGSMAVGNAIGIGENKYVYDSTGEGNITITATPDDNTSTDGSVGYVASVTGATPSVATGAQTLTVNAKTNAEITVAFAVVSVGAAVSGDSAVAINRYNAQNFGASAVENLKADVLSAVGLNPAEADLYKVTTSVSVYNGAELGGTGYLAGLVNAALAKALADDTSRSFTIEKKATATTPAVSLTVTLKIKDSRLSYELKDVEYTINKVGLTQETLESYIAERYAENLPDGITASEISISLADDSFPTLELDTVYVVTYKVSFGGNESYTASDDALITVNAKKLNPSCSVVVNADSSKASVKLNGNAVTADGNTVTGVDEGTVTLEITPVNGVAVSDVSVTYTYNNGDGEVIALDVDSLTYVGGVATATFTADGSDGGKKYTVSVSCEDVLTIENPPVVEYSYIENDVENYISQEEVFSSIVVAPELKDTDTVSVTYLAREATNYKITWKEIGVELPSIVTGIIGDSITIPLNEQWFAPDTHFIDKGDETFVAKVKEMLSDISLSNALSVISDITNLGTEELKYYGAHEFGSYGDESTETIRLSYNNSADLVINDLTLDVTIDDDRFKTTITANENVELYYGFTEEELREALAFSLTNEEGTVLDASLVKIDTSLDLNASETPYDITVHYAGDRDNSPCVATFSVTVNKAPCTLTYNSGTITYGEKFVFDLVTEPAGVETVEFLIGVDASVITADSYIPAAYIQVRIPESLEKVMSLLGIEKEMKLSELTSVLEKLTGLGDTILEGTGVDSETVQTVIDVLDSILEQVSVLNDTKIVISSEDFAPENIGFYIAGAVSIDSNYETAFGVGYVMIVPKTTEATLSYRFTDDNGIITKALILNDEFNLGADAFIDGEFSPEATEDVKHIFLSVDVEGNFEFIYAESNDLIDRERLAQVGAYTQASFILDVANEMYYALPIARAYIIAPELVNVTLTGEESVVYDGKAHGYEAVATDYNGDVIKDDNLTVTYVGYALNHPTKIYNSTEAPVDAGVYSVIAVYADEEREAYGADAAAFTILPAEATLEVENQTVHYTDEYDLGITAGPEDAKFLTIVAGIDVSGDISLDTMPKDVGVVNIDFPARLDSYLKEIMPTAYGDGITANAVLSNLEKASDKLEGLGLGEEAVNSIISVLDMLPQTELGNIKITFKDNIIPDKVGLYMVGAAVCDPNYTPVADVGYLLIQPDTIEAELAFNYEDANNIFTKNYIDNGSIDMGAHVAVTENVGADVAEYLTENKLHNLYIGVNEDGSFSVSDEVISEYGAYTQLSYLIDGGEEIYYAEPILRAYIVVPETCKVQLVDGEGAEADSFNATYDSSSKPVNYTVIHNDGTVLADSLKGVESEYLTLTYIGYALNRPDEIYNSTIAPTDAGVYAVTAIYADTEQGIYGADVATLTISPAEAKVEVADRSVVVGSDYDLGITVAPEDCKTINIVAGIDVRAEIDGGQPVLIKDVIYIDFPERIDTVLREVIPEAYTEEGIDVGAMISESTKDTLTDVLLKLGLTEENIGTVMSVLALADAKVSFLKAEAPKNIGVYLVGAISCDPNYTAAYDYGYIIVQPNIQKVELAFNYIDENNIFTANFIKNGAIDLGAHVVDNKDAERFFHNWYFGVDTEGNVIVSEEAPTAHGAYTQVAFIADAGNTIYYAEPIVRSYVVVPELVSVEFEDAQEFVYDGIPKFYDITVTAESTEATSNENIYVKYIGVDAYGNEYNSTDAPVKAGTYKVYAAYIDRSGDLYGMNSKELVINKCKLEAVINDSEKLVGDADPEFTWSFAEGYSPVDGDVIDLSLIRTSGEEAGEYVISYSAETSVIDSNYDVTVTDGKLTINKRAITITADDKTKTYGDTDPDFTYKVSGNFLIGHTADEIFAAVELSRAEGENVGEYKISIDSFVIKEDVVGVYDVATAEGALTVNKRPVEVIIDNSEKTVGEADPEFTWKLAEGSSLVGDDELNITLACDSQLKAGTYDIVVANDIAKDNANYDITVNNGTLAVAKRTITVTADNKTKTYGDTDPDLTYKVSGNFLSGHTADEIFATVELNRAEGENVGTYDINISNLTFNDGFGDIYEASTVGGVFTIVKKDNGWKTPLSIESWVYGDEMSTPVAEAEAGAVSFKYYTDAECNNEISDVSNLAVGTYYVKAFVNAGDNHNALESDAVEFSVLKNIDQHISDFGLQQTGNTQNDKGETEAYVRGFEYGSDISELIEKLTALDGATLVKFTDCNGNEITEGVIATGMEFYIEINGVSHKRIIVIMGDVTGDGKIRANDYVAIKNFIMDEGPALVDEYKLAADIDDNGAVRANDYVAIKNFIMEDTPILQTNKTWGVA